MQTVPPLAHVRHLARQMALAGRDLAQQLTALSRPAGLRRVALAGLLALLPLLGIGGVGAVPAQAADTWEVQVGGDDEASFVSTQSYFPGLVAIRAGDTVNFKFAAFHTVTFNGGQPDLPDVVPGPNPGELAFGPGFFPIGPQGANATYDGTGRANSGAPLQGPPNEFSYRLTFTRPGLYGYVCVLHPGMRGEIEVREANAALPETPAQARARGQATLPALIGRMNEAKQRVQPAHAGSVHAVTAGLGDAFGVSAMQFLNGDVAVQRGDSVVWTNADPYEIHTVTFAAGGPPPEFGEPRPQASGPPLIVIPANVVGPAGGESYTGQSYANSGILGPGNSYVLRFDASPGTYEYLCVIHPFMKGNITVNG